jgi:hypothetical protein
MGDLFGFFRELGEGFKGDGGLGPSNYLILHRFLAPYKHKHKSQLLIIHVILHTKHNNKTT